MPTNPQTHWRLEFAREIGQKLQRIPGIRAIVVGGSVACGCAVEDRFRRVYTLPMAEAAADTAAVVEETLQLVREHFPGLDVAPVHSRVRITRPAHTHPIHLEKTL